MKIFVVLALCFGVALANEGTNGNEIDACHDTVFAACSGAAPEDTILCNATISGFARAQPDLQSYVNSQLATSYDYLLLATHFDTYQKNRPGFVKLFQSLSGKAFDNAINLIKHITKRGGVADFNARHETPSTVSRRKNRLEVDELNALALVLDSEKKLAVDAHHIHRRISHLDSMKHYDPEVAQYLEEEFMEYQTETIRKLSGYANDLARLVRVPDPSLSIYMFDEYLQKQ